MECPALSLSLFVSLSSPPSLPLLSCTVACTFLWSPQSCFRFQVFLIRACDNLVYTPSRVGSKSRYLMLCLALPYCAPLYLRWLYTPYNFHPCLFNITSDRVWLPLLFFLLLMFCDHKSALSGGERCVIEFKHLLAACFHALCRCFAMCCLSPCLSCVVLARKVTRASASSIAWCVCYVVCRIRNFRRCLHNSLLFGLDLFIILPPPHPPLLGLNE